MQTAHCRGQEKVISQESERGFASEGSTLEVRTGAQMSTCGLLVLESFTLLCVQNIVE